MSKIFFRMQLSASVKNMLVQIPVTLTGGDHDHAAEWLTERQEQFPNQVLLMSIVDARDPDAILGKFGYMHDDAYGLQWYKDNGYTCKEVNITPSGKPKPAALVRFENACTARGLTKLGHKKYKNEVTGDYYVFKEQHSSGGTGPVWRELLWKGINIVYEGVAAGKMANKMPKIFKPRLISLEEFGGKNA